MNLYEQIPRSGAFWILLSVVVCVAPLVPYLPLWIPPLVAVVLIWRIGIYRGRAGAPNRWLKFWLVTASIGGLVASYGPVPGLEPMVSLLVCAFALKLLEMFRRRDALVVIFLAYFVALTLALFNSSLFAALYIAAAVVVVTASLAGLHRSETDNRRLRPLKIAVRILAQAFPLMVIFFVVMPRFGPFWSVPSPKTAVTGMTDSLELGGISRLAASPEVAFRVDFDGDIPPREQLYWRGLTLSHFNGRRWSQVVTGYQGGFVEWYGEHRHWWQENVDYDAGEPVSYRVTLEKTGSHWLYGLWAPVPQSPDTGLRRDLSLVNRDPINRRMEYRVASYPGTTLETAALQQYHRTINLRLPEHSNPETVRVARKWRDETPVPAELIARVLGYYHEKFVYTLSPAGLGEASIDDFLWNTREGFCEHFAAGFVFFMRAAGIPARIVAGYLGGEVNPGRDYLTVRQYDAHAWAEVWLDGEGWVRIDPTAAVAPERIVSSLLDMMTEEVVLAESPFDMMRYRKIPWLNRLRLMMENVDYNWARWVLGYEDVQMELLRRYLGGVEPHRIAAFLIIGALLALAPALLLLRRGGESGGDPVDRAYHRFCRQLSRAGCPRRPGEAPGDYGRRCAVLFPASAPIIKTITAEFVALKYSPGSGDAAGFIKCAKRFRVARRNLTLERKTTVESNA